MKQCFYCKKGELREATTTYMTDLETCIVVIRNVPCLECDVCGERYFTDEVMEQIDKTIRFARETASEIYVTDFEKQMRSMDPAA